MLGVLAGHRIEAVHTADRDRVVLLGLSGGLTLHLVVFGSRANALVVDREGLIVDAFLRSEALRGQAAPAFRAADGASEISDLDDNWPRAGTTRRALTRSIPLFDEVLATEALRRAGNLPEEAEACNAAGLARLLSICQDLERELVDPRPTIYESVRRAVFSLVPLTATGGGSEESFATVDEAAREYWIRTLQGSALEAVLGPFRHRLQSEIDRCSRTIVSMQSDLSDEGRADRYERYGHLLMTVADGGKRGLERIEIGDVFAGGEPTVIPLDADRSLHENAERYYDRARRSRASREHARARLADYRRRLERLERVLSESARASGLRKARRLVSEHSPLLPARAQVGGRREPGHRYELAGGAVALVGRNAKENDLITFQMARKHDLWMHARGYRGSHVVLRVSSKTERPPRNVIEAAASIAAHYSKGRGSELVPVIVAERKYVRKAKRGAPGQVIVEREEVLLVRPSLPTTGGG